MDVAELLERAREGDSEALEKLFDVYRSRLRFYVQTQMNPLLQGRIDASDVIQEVHLEATKQVQGYLEEPRLPFYLWLRHLAGVKLLEVHRYHLGTQKRSARQEISLEALCLPNTLGFGEEGIASNLTPASQIVIRREQANVIQETLEQLEPTDREVLLLRHFEMCNNAETAQVLGLSITAASNRYVRALLRFRKLLVSMPGFDSLTEHNEKSDDETHR